MSKLDRLVDNRIVQNIFIWFCLFFILLTVIQADNKALAALFAIAMLAPAIYINNLFILPYFNKNWIRFIAFFVLDALIFSLILVLLLVKVVKDNFQWTMLINMFGIYVLALIFGAAIKIARDSFNRRQQEKEAELQLLKAQLNPHFLFNTLNNLYGLSVIKSDKLPGLMLKLSELLRYSLYETKEIVVPVEKEIQYLESYIALEKIRLEDQVEIEFIKRGNFKSQMIAPMLLIVFVENAFKHLSQLKDGKSSVLVALEIADGTLSFKCSNTTDATIAATQNMEKGKSGIGLKNAKKRLNLLYPDTHQLKIHTEKNNYIVELRLHY